MFTAATELTTRMIAQHPIAKSGKAGKLSGAKAAKDQRGKPPAVKATAPAAKMTAKAPTAKAPTAKKPTAKKAALRPRPS
jgi:hypothetical protein